MGFHWIDLLSVNSRVKHTLLKGLKSKPFAPLCLGESGAFDAIKRQVLTLWHSSRINQLSNYGSASGGDRRRLTTHSVDVAFVCYRALACLYQSKFNRSVTCGSHVGTRRPQ